MKIVAALGPKSRHVRLSTALAMSLARLMAIGTLVLGGGAALAKVFKCTGANGRVEFSDVPCGKDAVARQVQAVRPNTLDQSGSREQIRLRDARVQDEQMQAEAAATTSSAETGDRTQASVCPTDHEIANMETSATSIVLDRRKREFLQDEIRRARQCRKGQGRYTADDWKKSAAARDSQRSLTGAAQGRAMAEGVHSAADPTEGDRIARQRAAETVAAELRRKQAAAPPLIVHSCDERGCITNRGFYFRHGNEYAGPGGARCVRTGDWLSCAGK